MRTEAHDPTRAGSPVPAAEVIFSLAEIQAACLKAARGSGLPWGLAEEVGASAAWLSAAGLPGPELILQFLQQPKCEAPQMIPGIWRAARGGPLCPVIAGTALSDFAALPECLGPERLVLKDLAYPLLILPFAAQIARRLARSLEVEWPNVRAVLGLEGYRLSIALPESELAPLATVALAWAGQVDGLVPVGRSGKRVALTVWQQLDELAMRTMVPATARSHADAGSSASDND
jgi:Protein of unknown function (DUF3726)